MNSKSKKVNKSIQNMSETEKIEDELEDGGYKNFHEQETSDSGNITFTKKTFSIGIILALIAVIAGFWGVYYFAGEDNPVEVKSEAKTSVEKVQQSVSGKSVEEDKKAALSSAQSILLNAGKSPDGKNTEDRVMALDKGDTSVVNDELKSKMRFKGNFETDEVLQNTTYQSLIILSSYLEEPGKVEPISEDVWEEVYLDQEAGIAFVPVSAFYGPGASFSFELVYTDGEWKLAPYSLLNIINFSSTLQNNMNNGNDSGIVPSVPNNG